MSTSKRRLAWVGLIVAALSLIVVAGVDDGGVETDAERVQRLASSYACPTCDGQSVADSNAAAAANIRQFLTESVAADLTDREIRDILLEDLNSADILLNPPAEGIATLVWILPVVFVVLGSVGVYAAVSRNRGAGREASTEDRDLLAEAVKDRARTGPEAER